MWTKDYKQCVICGTTERKHMAKGMCNPCYQKEYKKNEETRTRIAAFKHNWYLKNVDKYEKKRLREQIHFDGQREAILERDGYECKLCGEIRLSRLVVHHIDGNGRGSNNPNNSHLNLITLCRACHASVHYTNTLAQKLTKWSVNADKCIECGTSTVKHNAKGLCNNCYQRLHRKQIKAKSS